MLCTKLAKSKQTLGVWLVIEIIVELLNGLLQLLLRTVTYKYKKGMRYKSDISALSRMQLHLPGVVYFDNNKGPIVQSCSFQPGQK